MAGNPEMSKKIEKCLAKAPPRGFNHKEISHEAKICLGTVSKYVCLMEERGIVETEKIGNMELVRLKAPMENEGAVSK